MRRFVQALSGGSGFPASIPAPVIEQLVQLPDRYNISIHQPAGVLFIDAGVWKIAEMAWGLIPSWEPEPATRYSTQTARLERAPTSRLFRKSWAVRRCVVPMNGYYKWERQDSPSRLAAQASDQTDHPRRPRQPYFIQSCAGDVLFAPAMWSLWGEGEAQTVLSFSILTHVNPASPAPLVPDGPLFVEAARIGEWLGADANSARRMLLRMPQPRLEAYPVSRRVANRKLDDYSLLEPLSATEDFELAFDPDELDEDE
jgi:putative SOS response-associated peptidase YedK